MERNWDTIREILLRLEKLDPDKGGLDLNDFPSERAYEYSYHVELLIEAGLIYGQMAKTMGGGPSDFFADRLTWEGHEFLDAVRDETVWKKTKSSFISGGMSMTFGLVKSVATDIVSTYVKTKIGS